MSEHSADAEALEAMGLEGLTETMASMERLASPKWVVTTVRMLPEHAETVVRARMALGQGDVSAVKTLLEMLVDPILRSVAAELNERARASG